MADPYSADPAAEELQLLRQLRHGPVMVMHSATQAIAERLTASGHASWTILLAATALGRRRLAQEGPVPKPCPFCGADLVLQPWGGWAHPHLSRCILVNFATSNIEGWNIRHPAPAKGRLP